MCKFDFDYVSEVIGQGPCGRITGRFLGQLQNQTSSKSEDWAKRVRV